MAIDCKRIIRAVMGGSFIRDAKGIIPFFGVYLSVNRAQYYNYLSFEFERRFSSERRNEAVQLLIRSAQECAYATFHGIKSSQEWKKLVQPMIEVETDQVHAFAAIASAFGWGELFVDEIVFGEKLVLKAESGYEAEGYLSEYGLADSGTCYMLRGVTAGFMDLACGEDYPDGCYTYEAEETACRARGDSYCEFVARKKRSQKDR